MKGLERRGFRIRWVVLLLLLFPIAAGFAASLLLPGILERRITAELLKMGFRDVHLRVRSLGLGHIDLSEISLGAAPPGGATLASATVDFSLPELLKNRFERISLSGLEATLRIDRNGFTAPGLEPLLKPSTGEMPSFKRLVLKGGTITLLLPDRSLRIPLEADLATPDREGPTKIEVRLYPRGEEVRLSGAWTSGSGRTGHDDSGEGQRPLLPLRPLPPHPPPPPPGRLLGEPNGVPLLEDGLHRCHPQDSSLPPGLGEEHSERRGRPLLPDRQ